MNPRTAAGWLALVSGALLVVGMLLLGPAMAPGMMGGYPMMGPGMMGFANSAPAASSIPGAREVRVESFNFGFNPGELRLPKDSEVNLTFANPSATGTPHDFTVPTLGIHVVANPGETRTIGLRGLPAGRYDAHCSVPGHADAGMRATVIVE